MLGVIVPALDTKSTVTNISLEVAAEQTPFVTSAL